MILDEIDGAPQASIEFLLRFVSPGGVAQKYSKKTAGADKKFILKRPVICICNDLYAPALRQLRQVAFIVNFPQLDSGRLAERLTVIARMERIRTNMTALLALAEKTGNDVRSCLSMLQFHAGVRKPLTLIDVLRSNVGQKDRHKGLFATWSAIFQIQRPQKTIAAEDRASITMTDTSTKTRMETVLATVMSAGDYERLMQGVYENYLQQKMADPDLTSVAAATDWFCYNDRLQTEINHTQNYSTYPYLAFAFVVWHLSFSSMAWPKLHYPSKGFEVSERFCLQINVFGSLLMA
jgi:chromosome transmission fidelity protein 18